MAWSKQGSETLLSVADEIDVTTTPATFNTVLVHWVAAGTIDNSIKTGSTTIDTGSNYAYRKSTNGGADGTGGTSQTRFDVGVGGYATDSFSVIYFINISSKEKLFMGWLCHQNVVGAGSFPHRNAIVCKWANTSNQADILQARESSSGTVNDLAADTNISVLGTD